MKKILFVLCVLLLVPTLALASGDMVSVSELRQQVEAMGRWAKTYEAYGRLRWMCRLLCRKWKKCLS